MIKTRNLVPGIYYNESRDFQVLGRTFDILFNHVKTNVDLMKGLPFSKNCDIHLLPLLSVSLGFTNKRNYSNEELSALCSSFIYLLKIKGTKEAIQEAVNLMLHAHHINKIANVKQDDDFNFNIYIPEELDDTTILNDIFEYILPSGFTYNFINASLGHKYEGAHLSYKENYASRKFSTISDSAKIGIISKESNIEVPTMPSSGHTIPQSETSIVPAGTITIPDEEEE